MYSWIQWIEGTGAWAPWLMVGVFLAASLLTVWRLESMSAGGLEGTVLGTLVTPYITGMGNLFFAWLVARQKNGSATDVLTNCLVNNVTNMTLILGLPAVIWNMDLFAGKNVGKKPAKGKPASNTHEVNRLSLLLTLTAVLFFTGTTWALGSDGRIDFHDGLVLVGLFLFWQCFHVFEVLKTNARQNRRFSWMLAVDILLLAIGGYGVYASTKWLMDWSDHVTFVKAHLGWLSGLLDVLPNALLAIYYGFTRRPEVVYTSQVGDGHICIPLCIGIFALFKSITVPAFFQPGVIILLGATLAHFFFIAAFGKLPRLAGLALIGAYGYFVYAGFLK